MAETSRQRAYRWLDDHVGRDVLVDVTVEVAHSTSTVLESHGVLHKVVPEPALALGTADEGEETSGLYTVGGQMFDLSNLSPDTEFREGEHGTLAIALDDHVEIRVRPGKPDA
jgi:hypothetical protein